MNTNKEQEETRKPYWRCEECGYVPLNAKVPENDPVSREKYYRRIAKLGHHKCLKCRSESLMLVGY